MALRFMRPTKHSTTGIYRVRLTIPEPLRKTAQRMFGAKRELVANLETRDPREATIRAPEAMSTLRAKLETVRAASSGQGQHLSARQIKALAGELYTETVRQHDDDPGDPDRWFAWQAALTDEVADGRDGSGEYVPDAEALAEAEKFLARRGVAADVSSIRDMAVGLWQARLSSAILLERRAHGDWSADLVADTFPRKPAAIGVASPNGSIVLLLDLVRSWGIDRGLRQMDGQPIPRALWERQRAVARLAEWAGTKDAAVITRDKAVAYKTHLQEQGLTPSSVGNTISELSAIWKFGVTHNRLAANIWQGLLPPAKARRKKAKRLPYTDDQVVAVLKVARQESKALRWLPWCAALTGARITEIAQGVKGDIIPDLAEAGPFWRIHDDGDDRAEGEATRSVKNSASIRTIPIHPKLVAEGWLDYVMALPAGSPLFPDLAPDGMFGDRGVTAQRTLRKWVRETIGITDDHLSPAHSFRHWWIDQARRAGMNPETRDAITGHADTRNESASYGHGLRAMPDILAAAMATIRLPDGL